MKRKASAIWKGTPKDGSGALTSTSKVLNETPYSVNSRFNDEEGTSGTNPEELIAAAHAGCYSMALSFMLSEKGYSPTEIRTEAVLSADMVAGKFHISSIELNVVGEVPDISPEEFNELAEKAKESCPVSEALKAIKISLTAKLEASVGAGK